MSDKKLEESEAIKDGGSRATATFGKIGKHHWLCATQDSTGPCNCQPCPECTCGRCSIESCCPKHCKPSAP